MNGEREKKEDGFALNFFGWVMSDVFRLCLVFCWRWGVSEGNRLDIMMASRHLHMRGAIKYTHNTTKKQTDTAALVKSIQILNPRVNSQLL